MKLTRKHIGQLFDVCGSDGSWVYQLVAVRNGRLLFRSFDGNFYTEAVGRHEDWHPFRPQLPDSTNLRWGWKTAKEMEL